MQKKLIKVFAVFIFTFLLISSLRPIIIGSIPFWFDPARDLLAAWDNLRKPTLIGSTTGIPGIFYGPFWIWFLSLPLIISRDPRFATFIVVALPYFVFFPYILFKLSKVFSKRISFMLLIIFILSFGAYSNQLWNPNLSPLLYLILVYLMMTFKADCKRKSYLKALLTGIFLGLLINFHMSFGIGIFVGFVLFFIIIFLADIKKILIHLKLTAMMVLGFMIIFIPFGLFEVRHGFNQIKAFSLTMKKAVLENSAMVGQIGYSKQKILATFIKRFYDLLQIKSIPALVIILLIIYLLFLILKKKIKIGFYEFRLFLIIVLSSAGILFVYLTSKNPVWDYYFLAIEMIFLLLLGLLMKILPLFNVLISLWILFLLITNMISFFTTLNRKIDYTTLRSERQAVETIYKTNNKEPFAVFAKNPALYTYEYDYLFRWLGGEKYHLLPETDLSKVKNVYLIIPKEPKHDQEGFILYKTSSEEFKTEKEWLLEDETRVVKRVRYIDISN